MATTLLLWWISGTYSLEALSALVELGVVVYGVALVIIERGVAMVFWALEQRRKMREQTDREVLERKLKEARPGETVEDFRNRILKPTQPQR